MPSFDGVRHEVPSALNHGACSCWRLGIIGRASGIETDPADGRRLHGAGFGYGSSDTDTVPGDVKDVDMQANAEIHFTGSTTTDNGMTFGVNVQLEAESTGADLIRCTVTDEHGNPVFRRPMWLVVMDKRRREITLTEGYEAYRQHFDLKHFFRCTLLILRATPYRLPP